MVFNILQPLISSESNEKAMLGVSSLVYAYCQKASCENDIEIAGIVSAIEAKIGVGCYIDKNNLNQVNPNKNHYIHIPDIIIPYKNVNQ